MADLKGSIGEMRFTVQITRKATGKTETYEMVGFVDEEKFKAFQAAKLQEKESNHGSHP